MSSIRPTRSAWKVASWAGIPIRLSWTWIIFAVAIIALFGPVVSRAIPDLSVLHSYGIAALYALIMLATVFFHEFAHAVMARAFGWQVHEITVNIWGGFTAFDVGNRPQTHTPGRSLLTALAGPLANVIIAVVCTALTHIWVPGPAGSLLLLFTIYVNWLIAIFNLLPGHPLDGGRLVESVVWKLTGDPERGLLAAGWAGRGIAVLLIIAVILIPALRDEQFSLTTIALAVFIAWFLFQSATQAIRTARTRMAARALTTASLMHPAFAVDPHTSIQQLRHMMAQQPLNPGTEPSIAVVVSTTEYAGATYRTVLGVVEKNILDTVPVVQSEQVPVLAVATRTAPDAWITESSSGLAILSRAESHPQSPLIVVDELGKVIGVIHRAEVLRTMSRLRY